MQTRLIGLVGATGSGKSTLARFLVAQRGFELIHLGRPLKEMLLALGVSRQSVEGTPEQRELPLELLGGRSARYAMKTLGTDWGRNMITPDLWANALRQRLEKQLAEHPKTWVIVDDLRFPNDWECVRNLGGTILTIRRPSVEHSRRWRDLVYYRFRLNRLLPHRMFARWQLLHETEFHWWDAPRTAEVCNSGTVEELALAALKAAKVE